MTGAIKGLSELWQHVPTTAKLSRVEVGAAIPWDEFQVRQLNARAAGLPAASITRRDAAASGLLLAEAATSDTGPSDMTTSNTTPPDNTQTTPTPSTPMQSTPSDTTLGAPQTTTTQTTPNAPNAPSTAFKAKAASQIPVDPTSGKLPHKTKQSLTPVEQKYLDNLALQIRAETKLPPGCEDSVTSESCPAAVHLGGLPGPVKTPQGAVERYAYVDQKHVLRYLVRTLPLVRHSKRRGVPLGLDVLVQLKLTGDGPFFLQWSVYPEGSGGGPLLNWEKNRIADIIRAGHSPHLTRFWVPIPVRKHRYFLHLRVLDKHGNTLDDQNAPRAFR